MLLARTFSSITGLATGVFFLLLTTGSLRATLVHSQNANTNSAALTLSVAFLLLLCALFFALPTARKRLVRLTYPMASRMLFILVMLAVFGLVASLIAKSPNISQSPLFFGASQEALILALAALAFVFLMTFALPGFAYGELRAVYRGLDVHNQEAIHAASTVFEDRRGPVKKLLSGAFGLMSIGVVGSAAYGLSHAQFLSSAEHVAIVKEHAVYIVGSFAVIVLLSFFLGLKTAVSGQSALIRWRPVVIVLFAAPISLFSIPAAQTGIPAILSLSEDGRYDRIQVKVVRRGKASGRRTCDRQATVVWEVHNRRLCNVPEHIWRNVQSGDLLELEGFQTEYGFRYERVRKPR